MRGRSLTLVVWALCVASMLGAPTTAKAHFVAWAKGSPVYPGAYPRTLCYKIVGNMANDQLWVSWIDNAATLWNRANTGWTFKKCETDDEKNHPNIVFTFSTGGGKIDGGAQGSGHGGGPDLGDWQIEVDQDVTGTSINGTKVGKGGHQGWALEDKNGTATLDPILVMEHELGHALGLDHNPNSCYAPTTGDVEDPVCAGTHHGPNGRNPSASDVAEVKKGIAAYQKAVDDAKKTADGASGTNPKNNQMAPSDNGPPGSGQTVWHYCDNPAGYYPQVTNCNTPWRDVGADGQPISDNGPPPSGPDSGPGPGVVPGFGIGGFGFGFGSGRSNDGPDDRGSSDRRTRRP